MLLDRRRVGWKSGQDARSGAKGSSSSSSSRAFAASPWRGGTDGGLFEVYEAPASEGNNTLAHMLEEEVAM